MYMIFPIDPNEALEAGILSLSLTFMVAENGEWLFTALSPL